MGNVEQNFIAYDLRKHPCHHKLLLVYFLTEGVPVVSRLADPGPEEGAFTGVAAAASPKLLVGGGISAFLSVCLRAWPNSTLRHRDAKFNEHTDSPAL